MYNGMPLHSRVPSVFGRHRRGRSRAGRPRTMIQAIWHRWHMQICSAVFSVLLGAIVSLMLWLIGVNLWMCGFDACLTMFVAYFSLEGGE